MAPMKFFGFVKWGGSKKEASTVDFAGSEPGHFPNQDGSQSPTSPISPQAMSKKERKEREKREKREKKMREKEMKMAGGGRGGWANQQQDDYSRGGMGGGYARSISPISVTSLELERKANARMVKEGHGILEQALSMVKEHQQLLAMDAAYWRARINEYVSVIFCFETC